MLKLRFPVGYLYRSYPCGLKVEAVSDIRFYLGIADRSS